MQTASDWERRAAVTSGERDAASPSVSATSGPEGNPLVSAHRTDRHSGRADRGIARATGVPTGRTWPRRARMPGVAAPPREASRPPIANRNHRVAVLRTRGHDLLPRHPMPPRSDARQHQARRCYGRLIHSRHSARSSSHAVRRLARKPARLRYAATAATSATTRKARRIVLVMGVATFGGGNRLSAEVLGGCSEPSGRYAE